MVTQYVCCGVGRQLVSFTPRFSEVLAVECFAQKRSLIHTRLQPGDGSFNADGNRLSGNNIVEYSTAFKGTHFEAAAEQR